MPGISLTPEELQRFTVVTAAINGHNTNGQAAKKLNISVRQLQRLKSDVRSAGIFSVAHKLKGKAGNHRIDHNLKKQILDDIKLKYSDFKPKLVTEKLYEEYQLPITSQTIRVWMIEAGLWKVKSQKQAKYYAWRQRKAYFGQLQQFDGSHTTCGLKAGF